MHRRTLLKSGLISGSVITGTQWMTRVTSAQQTTDEVDIEFGGGDWAGGQGNHAVRMPIESPGWFQNDSRMTLTPGVYQFEIERVDTNQSIVFEMDSELSSTVEATSIHNEFYDSTGSVNDSPTIEIREDDGQQEFSVSQVSGDDSIFSSGDVFGNYIIRLLKEGTTLGSTDERVHGIGYPDNYQESHQGGVAHVTFPAVDELDNSWDISISISNVSRNNDETNSFEEDSPHQSKLNIDGDQLTTSFELDDLEPVPEEGYQLCWIEFSNGADDGSNLVCRGYFAENGEDRSEVIRMATNGPTVFQRFSTATDSPAVLGLAGAGGVGAAYFGYKRVLSGSEDGSQQEADDNDSKTSNTESMPVESSFDTIQVEQFTDLDLTETVTETSAYHLYHATASDGQCWVMTPPEKSLETIEISEFKPFVETIKQWNQMRSHPYITSVYGFGDHPLPWVAFEPCDDTALVDSVESLSTTDTLDALQQICDGLHHIHRYGTTYENLTTESVLYTADGQIKLRGVLDQFDESNPWYNAPEEFDGESTEQSSVYCIGLIAYELLTGTLPYADYPEGNATEAIQAGEIIRPSDQRSDIPDSIESVLMMALSESPQDRQETVLHLRDDFESVSTN